MTKQTPLGMSNTQVVLIAFIITAIGAAAPWGIDTWISNHKAKPAQPQPTDIAGQFILQVEPEYTAKNHIRHNMDGTIVLSKGTSKDDAIRLLVYLLENSEKTSFGQPTKEWQQWPIVEEAK